MPRRLDAIDQACELWAAAVRSYLEPRLSSDMVGSLRCTLAARRDLHHGARGSRIDLRWPEFPYRGEAGLVNAVYKRRPESEQEILVAHYVVMSPRSKSARADLMGISTREYWLRLGRAKAAVDGALTIVETVCTV